MCASIAIELCPAIIFNGLYGCGGLESLDLNLPFQKRMPEKNLTINRNCERSLVIDWFVKYFGITRKIFKLAEIIEVYKRCWTEE